MSCKFVETEVVNNIATMVLARTESLNALNEDFATEITETARDLGNRDDVWVIVLISNARIFCAGLDLKNTGSDEEKTTKYHLQYTRKHHYMLDCCNIFEEISKPVIAAVHGKCIGGGLDMIAACDIRLCSEDATFALRQARIGLVGDLGTLQRLPLVIGQGFTREMAYTARYYSAEEARLMGLVNRVFPDKQALMEGATNLAQEITKNAPLAVQQSKEVLNYSRYVPVEEGMTMGLHKNYLLFSSNDMQEAVKAVIEKRTPQFKGE